MVIVLGACLVAVISQATLEFAFTPDTTQYHGPCTIKPTDPTPALVAECGQDL
jgi:hypothetical protein